MALTNLAPDIQEEVLFLPLVMRGREPVQMADLVTVVAKPPALPAWIRLLSAS
jgi:hypothetical protein